MKSSIANSQQQSGSTLLEALIAILIFSLGILAIVGMQAASISASTEAKYRSDANLLANQLLGIMQSSDAATLATNFAGTGGSGGAGYNEWMNRYVSAGSIKLPGVATYPPAVVVDAATGLVTIQVFWLAPGDTSGAPHNFTLVSRIVKDS
jgi:type IV pilus assembly protein PilV